MTIQETQSEIIEEFGYFDDWTEKYAHLIEYGKELAAFPEEHRNEEHLVKGCISRVWLHAEAKDQSIAFHADSDAMITKGMIALLLKVYAGRSPKEIIENPPTFIEAIGLSSHLSPNRANGLASMVRQIQNYAVAIHAIQQK